MFNSTTRFILVCALFVAFYHFTFIVAALWLALPLLCSFGHWLGKMDELPATNPSSYDRVATAFDEIFNDPIDALSHKELQQLIKSRTTATQRSELGIKLNSSRLTLITQLSTL